MEAQLAYVHIAHMFFFAHLAPICHAQSGLINKIFPSELSRKVFLRVRCWLGTTGTVNFHNVHVKKLQAYSYICIKCCDANRKIISSGFCCKVYTDTFKKPRK